MTTALVPVLEWRRVYRRPDANPMFPRTAFVADVPADMAVYVCGVLRSPLPGGKPAPISLVWKASGTAPSVWKTADIPEVWSFEADEHQLVPEAWHGLGYRPQPRQEMPATYEYAHFRGVCSGRPVEGVGYATTGGMIVRIGDVEVAVENAAWPRDAIFAWRPIPPCDWEAAQ